MEYDKKAWLETIGEDFQEALDMKQFDRAEKIINELNHGGCTKEAVDCAEELAAAKASEGDKLEDIKLDNPFSFEGAQAIINQANKSIYGV
jgi:hypothetical protein